MTSRDDDLRGKGRAGCQVKTSLYSVPFSVLRFLPDCRSSEKNLAYTAVRWQTPLRSGVF